MTYDDRTARTSSFTSFSDFRLPTLANIIEVQEQSRPRFDPCVAMLKIGKDLR